MYCHKCPELKRWTAISNFRRHIRNHPEPRRRNFVCDECGVDFRQESRFLNHDCVKRRNETAEVVRYDLRDDSTFVHQHFTDKDCHELMMIRYCVSERKALVRFFPAILPPLNMRGRDNFNEYGSSTNGTKILEKVNQKFIHWFCQISDTTTFHCRLYTKHMMRVRITCSFIGLSIFSKTMSLSRRWGKTSWSPKVSSFNVPLKIQNYSESSWQIHPKTGMMAKTWTLTQAIL